MPHLRVDKVTRLAPSETYKLLLNQKWADSQTLKNLETQRWEGRGNREQVVIYLRYREEGKDIRNRVFSYHICQHITYANPRAYWRQGNRNVYIYIQIINKPSYANTSKTQMKSAIRKTQHHDKQRWSSVLFVSILRFTRTIQDQPVLFFTWAKLFDGWFKANMETGCLGKAPNEHTFTRLPA